MKEFRVCNLSYYNSVVMSIQMQSGGSFNIQNNNELSLCRSPLMETRLSEISKSQTIVFLQELS